MVIGRSPAISFRAVVGLGKRATLAAGAGLLVAGLALQILPGGSSALPGSALISSACSGYWPMFQHDQTHTATQACSGISQGDVTTLKSEWFAKTAGAVTAEPVADDGLVFVGDSTGVFSAVNQQTGDVSWTFNITSNSVHDDKHSVSFGEIPASAAVSKIAGPWSDRDPTVFMVGGGTVYALDAATGTARWAQDTDPLDPTSAVETESSPVIDTATFPPEVILGNDTNQSPGVAMTGVMAFDAFNGRLLWKYEPQSDTVLTPAEFCSGNSTYGCATPDTTNDALSYGDGAKSTPPDNACGDVWSSPALDQAKGLVVFATGDCPQSSPGQFTTIQSVFAIEARSGKLKWDFPEPANNYNDATLNGSTDDGDDDFGASPIITGVDDSTGHPIVIQAGKSGYIYGLDELTGKEQWQVQAAQPGQLSPQLVGAVGGFIGSPALGEANGQQAIFLTSAIFTPLTSVGANAGPPPYPTCPSPVSASLPVCPDTGLPGDPTRLASVHAVSVATGSVLWQAPISTPTYAPATYSNGVVFAPSTTNFSLEAYDADTGLPLYAFPLGAAAASGAAIAGSGVFVGSGIAEGGETVPGEDGIWFFAPGASAVPPSVSG